MKRKHNLDLNYNLMGFDSIEINLVFFICGIIKLTKLIQVCRVEYSPV